jgi:uncharacterized membrane protein (DUF485 family)
MTTDYPLAMRVPGHPGYARLKSARHVLAVGFTGICLGLTATFILLVIFAPSLLARPVSPGSTMTVGVLLGVSLMALAWLLTGLYIYLANVRLDAMRDHLLQEVRR